MPELVAAVIAGVPARIINQVLASVREGQPDILVLRAIGAKLRHAGRATYSMDYIRRIEAEAIDAVFGQSGRPYGFCRNPQKPCAKGKDSGRANCGASEDGACGRQKPARFVLFYQEGGADAEGELIKYFRYTALAVRIPAYAYDSLRQTSEFISETIASLDQMTARSANNLASTAPALLLPPINFGRKQLQKLLKNAVSGAASKAEIRQFRSAFLRSNQYFEGRAKLAFQPTYPEIAHGIAGARADGISALAAHYRVGCAFGEFHWDVYPTSTAGWAGALIHCRDEGQVTPSNDHVNLLVDDRIRA